MSEPSTSPWAANGSVDVDIADGVATVTLNRQPGNGWTPLIGRRFFAVLEELSGNLDVRAIVVTGAGRDFCVGGDSDSLSNVADGESFQIAAVKPQYWMTLTMGKPVIAAVNGAAFGAGMSIALLCDVRFAGESTKFATAFVRRGLSAELGITWTLPRLVGTGVANDLLLSGRLVRPAEALQIGLVNRVVPDDELLTAAVAYATELAAKCSPNAMAVVKRQLNTDLGSTLPESINRGYDDMQEALASADFTEGMRSWRDKRAPEFGRLDPDKERFQIPGMP